jgi:P-type Cu+ transporter
VRAAGPVADPVPCSGCQRLIDPLRAGHVAIFDNQLHYFCDRKRCRAAFLAPFAEVAEQVRSPPPRSVVPQPVGDTIVSAHAPVIPEDELPELPRLDDDRAFVEPIARSILTELPPHVEVAEPRDVGALLLLIAAVAGVLAVLLGLAGPGRLVLAARVVLAGVGAGMLVARRLTIPREPVEPHPLPILAGPVLAVGIAAWALVPREGVVDAALVASEAASLAGAIAAAAAIGAWLLESARGFVESERAHVAISLEPAIAALHDATVRGSSATDIRVGETVTLEMGELVPVDLVVEGDEVDVLPWLGATTPTRRRAGDAVVAGARVARGRLRGVCTFTGADRAFVRVLVDPRRRADALASAASAARSLAERWSPVAAGAAGVLTYLITRSGIDALMVSVAVLAGLSSALVGTLASVHVARGILLAQRRGITYKSADAWERAAQASVAIFCARGTLLLGEPEVAEVQAIAHDLDADDVLSLAGGAERAESHPTAQAILRAAKARGVRPDAVRNPNAEPGLGVVAVTSAGEELCVGNRALLMRQRVAMASAEERIADLESMGRSVVLVALGSRLVGLIALEDGIRPGARASIQHLLDAGIEPVLLSGDARETCEAIARSLDIDHIRPEVLPDDRATEVKRIAESGASVAVLGHVGLDDPALGAADVAIALSSAGRSAEHEVALASDDVRDAALALALARRTRTEARVGFGLAAIPPALGSFVVALGVLPPVFVPIAALIGGAMGVVHGRSLDRDRFAV